MAVTLDAHREGAPGGRFTGEGDVVVGATADALGLHGGVRVRFRG